MIRLLVLAQLAVATGPGVARPLAPADSVPAVTLAEALERSLALNPNYVQALGQVAEADWVRKMSRVAFLLPSVTASLDYTKYSKAFFNIGTLTPSSTASTFRASATYEVLSARKFTELGRAQAELEGATSTEVQQRFAAALLTESAFYAVLADQELTRVATERAERAEEQLRVARARVASGAAVQSDSLTVRLEVVRARATLLRQRAALQVSELELGRRIGLAGPARAVPPVAPPPATLPITLPDAISRALEQGPEYRAVRARERAARAQLRGRQGGYLPTLTLGAGHNRFDTGLFPNASNVSSVTLTLSLPIWDGGTRELGIRQARTSLDVARAVRSDLERAAYRDVTEAYTGYETAQAEVGLAEDALVVATENYRVQDARYRAGATTVLDLLTAQDALSQAEAQLVQSRYSARLALAQLEAILGSRFANDNGGGQ